MWTSNAWYSDDMEYSPYERCSTNNYLFIKRNSDKSNNNSRHAMSSISSASEASNIQYILWLLFAISTVVRSALQWLVENSKLFHNRLKSKFTQTTDNQHFRYNVRCVVTLNKYREVRIIIQSVISCVYMLYVLWFEG